MPRHTIVAFDSACPPIRAEGALATHAVQRSTASRIRADQGVTPGLDNERQRLTTTGEAEPLANPLQNRFGARELVFAAIIDASGANLRGLYTPARRVVPPSDSRYTLARRRAYHIRQSLYS